MYSSSALHSSSRESANEQVISEGRPVLLVVDDEEGPRESLRVMFKDQYELLTAENGLQALGLVQSNRIDVAVLDVRMAGMDGLELLERIREVDSSVEVVIMTAFETAGTLRKALRLQACDFVTKPFDVATMRGAVATALRRRTLASELRTNAENLKRLQEELNEKRVMDEMARAQGEIYASMIHDINGPLTVISALIQGMDDEMGEATLLEGEELDSLKDRLKRITRQVTNCIAVSRRYLSLLRQSPGDTTHVWINQILSDLRELLNAYPVGSHRLLIHPLPEDVQVPIHGTDLTQILRNLTLNALQCGKRQHRVDVRGQLIPHSLDLSHFEDGPEDLFVNRAQFENAPTLLALSVQDSGPGIPPEILPRIFDAYFTTRSREQGTGLGLHIAQRLLRDAKGALHVHTKVGQGTVFTVYLPARPGPG